MRATPTIKACEADAPERVPTPRRRPSRAALIAAITIAAIVGTTLPTLATPAHAAVATKKKVKAKLKIEAPGVSVLRKKALNFKRAKHNLKLRKGDTVQTDATGFAEILYADGSLTRLDHNTVFTLRKLVNKTGNRKVKTTVSAGQTWNRVQKLSESDTFKQKGSGATAAVLGTAFITRCTLPVGFVFEVIKTRKALRELRTKATCTFILVDGLIRLASSSGSLLDLLRGQSVKVSETGDAGDAETVAPDILYTDGWVQKNLAADWLAGKSEASGEPTPDDIKYARIEGSWVVTLDVVESTGFRDLAPSRTRTYAFEVSCDGSTCQVTLTRETASGSREIALAFADGVYSGEDPDLGTQDCVLDDGTVSVSDGVKNSGTVMISPSAAVASNGLWLATSITGKVTEIATQVAGQPGQCISGTATFDMAAAR